MKNEPPRIQKKVDEDWKNQVEREKSADAASPRPVAQAEAPRAQQPEAGDPHPAEDADLFEMFLSSLAMQAYVALGEQPDPATGARQIHLEQAQYMIDILGLIARKTRGNLSKPEERALWALLYDLRMKFVEKKGL